MNTTNFSTCDLCDANLEQLSLGGVTVMPPIFGHWGKATRFSGRATTLQVFEDNVMVRAALEQPGHGQVLVIDGGASLRCALVGGQLGALAEKNNWVGIIVNGCVRDSQELNACQVGIRALALHPQRSQRTGAGEQHHPVTIAGVTITPGDWIYADEDGIVVARHALR